MTHARGLARGSGIAAAIASALSLLLAGWPSAGEAAKAKSPPPPKEQQEGPSRGGAPQGDSEEATAQKKQAAIAGRQAYDAGLKNFANGRYQESIDLITTALKSGGLTAPEMAKALYTRGIAYKKQNKPGLAISDLTSALWLKNGLNGGERETATAERAEAFKMAGLEDTGKGAERVIADSGANASSAGLSAEAIAQASANPSSGAPAVPVTRQDATSEAAQDAARARDSYHPADEGGLQSAATSRVVAAGESAPAGVASSNFTTTSTPAQAPAATSSGYGLSSVTGFFSNMFGGGSSAAPAPAPAAEASVMTASTTPEDAASSWSSATTVTEGGAHGPAHKQVAVAAPPAPPAAAPKGKYKVHVAALRSKAEAEALAQQLVAQHGGDLTNHVPTVDEAVIGSMGTFYRVRVGGYASQDEPRELCNKLRTSGLDCLVVTN